MLLAPANGQKQTAPANAAGHIGVVTQDSQRIQGLLFGVQIGKDVGIASATFDGTKFKVDFSATTVITTPFNIGFYQSDDAKFSASDRRFGQLLSVTPPESGQGTAEFTIPSAYVHDKTKPFLLVVADPDGRIVEVTETNNTLTATRIIDVSPLKIVGGNFQYDRLTDSFKATGGEFTIGYKPETAEPFFPLVTVNGDVSYNSKTIESNGAVSATVGAFSTPLFTGKWDLRFADQTSTSLKPSLLSLSLAGLGFKFHSLKLTNPAGGLTLDSFIELTGKIAIPSTASEQTQFRPVEIEFTAENPLKLKSDGPHLAGRINLPPFKFELFGMEIETESVSLEYFHLRRAFRLQGKVTLNNVLKVLGGDLVKKISADFSDQNYLELNRLGFTAIGNIEIEKIEIIPKQFELRNVKFSFNTLTNEWRGESEIKIPILPGNTTLIAGLGFRNSELNFIRVGADHLNIFLPLLSPSSRPMVLQKVQIQLDNLVDLDPHAAEFGATIGVTDSLELIPRTSPPGDPFEVFADYFSGPLFRLDVTGNISGNHLVGAGELVVVNKDFVSITGQLELDWKELHNPGSVFHPAWERLALKAKGTLKAFGGAVDGKFDATIASDLSTPEGTRSITASGELTFKFTEDQKEALNQKLPEWVVKRLINRTISGKGNLSYVADNSSANDYLVVYGDLDLPVIGRKTLGFRAGFDGSFEWLSNLIAISAASSPAPSAMSETPSDTSGGTLRLAESSAASTPANEFTIGAGTQHLLLAASWQNDVGDVPLEVVDPSGNVIAEADFKSAGIAVLSDFSTSTSKAIGLAAPTVGTWTIRAASPEGLGDIVYEAAHESAIPTVEITGVTRVDSTVTIDYSAADPDSDATVRFFYDTDGEGFDGVQFGSDLAETDSSGSTTWNVTNLPAGTYHIYAMIDDGNNAPVFAYAET
ncbi:MAG: hypothetical protein FD138_1550, partial [Planctomycetota bacterium]